MKKIVAMILVAIMAFGCVSAFAACAPTKDPDTLVMATNAAFPPYEYKEGDGYAGIDVEIATAIAEKLGMKLEIADIDFGAIIGGVETGKYDFGMAGLTVTPERQEQVNFSTTYATGVQVIIVKEGSNITSLDDVFTYDENGDPNGLNPEVVDVNNFKVGVQQDTTGDIYCSADFADWGFNTCNDEGKIMIDRVERFKTGADAVAALKNGQVDMVIIDNEPAKSFVAANEGAVKILESEYTTEEYAICVNKENNELLKQIDEALAELKANGTIDKIIAKYINDGSSAE